MNHECFDFSFHFVQTASDAGIDAKNVAKIQTKSRYMKMRYFYWVKENQIIRGKFIEIIATSVDEECDDWTNTNK